MPSSRKKVIIRKLTGSWTAGYMLFNEALSSGNLYMLALDGKSLQLPTETIKWIACVRDFNSGEMNNPERLIRKTYAARPRTPGLVVRLKLRDSDGIEGLASNDRTLIVNDGVLLVPPDTRSNTQRLWIPRTAIDTFEVLAVIGGANIGKPATSPKTDAQKSLF